MRKLAILLLALPAFAPAEIILTAHLDVDGTPSIHDATPTVGDYKFVFGPTQTYVNAPNGKTFIFNFNDNSFTSVNPAQQTFYQQNIDEVLTLGSRAGLGQVNGSVTFAPTSGAGSSPPIARNAVPYRVSLQAVRSEKTGSPGAIGGGYTPNGGLVFSGAGSSDRSSVTGRRVLEGRLWLGNRALEIDRDQMNTAIECVLLWGAPELKELDQRIRKTKLAIFGGEYAMTSHGQRETFGGASVPTVTFTVRSIETGPFVAAYLEVPQNCKRISPPVIRFQ